MLRIHFFLIMVCGFLLFNTSGCRKSEVKQLSVSNDRVRQTPSAESTTLKKGSNEMLAIVKRIYERLEKETPLSGDEKERYEKSCQLRRRAIDELVGNDKKKADRLVQEALDAKNDHFASGVFVEMIAFFCDRNDRDSLSNLLSRRCPKWMYAGLTVEGYLAIVADKTFPDGILALCDAFEKSESKEVRHQIAETLRRGFTVFGVESEDDRQLVQNCRRWYCENRGDYDVNYEYLGKLGRLNVDSKGKRISQEMAMRQTGLFALREKVVEDKKTGHTQKEETPKTTSEPDKVEDCPDPFN